MNKLGAGKLHSFGKLLKKGEFRDGDDIIKFNSWVELTNFDEWDNFIARWHITDEQIEFIKQGYHGKPLQYSNPKKQEDDDIIFPFGAHKGKPISKVPMDYIVWCSKQNWLEKWPTLNDWLKRNKEKIDKEIEGTEEGLSQLSELRKQLTK